MPYHLDWWIQKKDRIQDAVDIYIIVELDDWQHVMVYRELVCGDKACW